MRICETANCGNQQEKRYKNGKVRGYRRTCTSCRRRQVGRPIGSTRTYAGFKKAEVCPRCGFKAEHWSQMDIDHIDANRSNNDPSNLQTLCANCHRLKTVRERQVGL